MAASTRAFPSAAAISHPDKTAASQSTQSPHGNSDGKPNGKSTEGTAASASAIAGAPTESDEDLSAFTGNNSRERLGSEGSSKASKKNIPQKAASATSKSSAGGRPRQDSLKRTKESAESSAPATTPTRGAQSTRPAHSRPHEAYGAGPRREPHKFIVGNVGAGGQIYLTPSQKTIVSASPSSPVQSPSRARAKTTFGRHEDTPREEQEDRNTVSTEPKDGDKGGDANDDHADNMSDSLVDNGSAVPTDFTGNGSVWTKLSTTPDVGTTSSDVFNLRRRSRRSMSESTASNAPGRAALAQTKAFKVVIDRPDVNLVSAQYQLGPSFDGLDIPIPNSHMGSPHFTEQGTPFLQGSASAFAAASPAGPLYPTGGQQGQQQHQHQQQQQFLERIPDSAPMVSVLAPSPIMRQLPSRRHSHASPYTQSVASYSYDSVLLPSQFEPMSVSRQPTAGESISPVVYDILAADLEHESVVQYREKSREIIYATPARLIVQITAETFLDYELLSDFFLTVRSYLPTHTLLSLLMARFEWAVNRLDDGGRIIRVRSFAAIRHWILNYFAYDFMPDRRLRLQFTRKLNQLYRLVQSRGEAGLPDLKLISDLKKCWNGRCVLYWAGPVDNSAEADLLPGGPTPDGGDEEEEEEDEEEEEEDEEEEGEEGEEEDDTALGSVTAASTDGMYSTPGSPPANYNISQDRDRERERDRDDGSEKQVRSRATSGATTRSTPMSPGSETSTTNSARRVHVKPSNGSVGSGQRQHGNYRQSTTSSDFAGGGSQTSYEQPVAPAQPQANPYRSVLRGHLLAPASPYVTTTTSTSASRSKSHGLAPGGSAGTPNKRNMNSGISAGPGVKQIMHNIKRALSSKVSSSSGVPLDHAILLDGSGKEGQRTDTSGRYAGYSNNNTLKKYAGATAVSNNVADSIRAAMRIDMLAHQVTVEFQRAIRGEYNRQPVRPVDMRMQQQQILPQQSQRVPNGAIQPTRGVSMLAPAISKQVPSGMTSSSQSIVIFDDTGDRPPLGAVAGSMNGLNPKAIPPQQQQQQAGRADAQRLGPPVAASHPRQKGAGNFEVSAHELDSNATSAAATPARLSFVGAHHRQRSQSSMSLRRVASYQSALNRPVLETSAQEMLVPDPSKQDGSMIPASAVPARGLRRVPGGDLRANQNIADLEGPLPRPKSTGSIATFASTRESEILSFGARITKTFKRDRTDRPLMSPNINETFGTPFKRDAEQVSLAESKVSYVRSQSDDKAGRRQSFDDFVKSFAEIPDEDEGGPEIALLKLEGTYRKGAVAKAKAAMNAVNAVNENEKLLAPATQRSPPSNSSADTLHAKQAARSTIASTRSEDSFNSTPILEREPAASPRSKSRGLLATRTSLGMRPKTNAHRATTKSFLLDELDDSGSEPFSEDSRRPSDATTYQSDTPTSPRNNGVARAQWQTVTTGMSPNRSFVERHIGQTGGPTSQTHPAVHIPLTSGLTPRHMPFVLVHDSKVLCEQLTLIEKDALREIDWRDLVDMRWKHPPPKDPFEPEPEEITNWVSYLMSPDAPLGIDLVTERFNIMIKWVVSEIVLTESIEERANVIMKFIQIAREARRVCNYATMMQFTLALKSDDCTRMRKTWALVPQADQNTLDELFALVEPTGNFSNLRSEMEDAPAETGCIPALVLYTRSLTANAAHPATMRVKVEPQAAAKFAAAAQRAGQDGQKESMKRFRELINFGRYRNAAVIVKSLLRLIDASSRYNYVPVDDVLSHCMWISCLPKFVIEQRSKQLEGLPLGPTLSGTGQFRY